MPTLQAMVAKIAQQNDPMMIWTLLDTLRATIQCFIVEGLCTQPLIG
jgi:hypothetical protein